MKIVTLFLFFVYYSSFSLFFACDRTNLDVISLIQNPNGTYTYNFFICIETRPDFIYGNHTELVFSFPASGAKILGLTPGSIGFENGVNWTISGLNSTSAKYSGAALNFYTSSSVVKHPTNPRTNQQCFNFSVTIDRNPNIGPGMKYKVQVGANGGSCIKESENTTLVNKNRPTYLPTNGLIGWWPFNGNSVDESGNGNHGTIIGPFNFNTDRNGKINSSLFIDSNTRIEIPSICGFNVLKYTVSTWIYKSSQNANANSTLFSQGSGLNGANGIRLWIDENNALSLNINDEQNKYSVGIKVKDKNFSDNKWHHIVGVIDADTGFFNDSNFKIYVDGVLATSLIYSNETRIISPLTNYSAICSTTLGNNGINNNTSKGILDDIAIYNRALTPQEIAELYKSCNKPFASIKPLSTTSLLENQTVVLSTINEIEYNYQWFKDGISIANATNSNFTASLPGIYTVKISNSNSCDSTSAGVTVKRIYTLPNYLPSNGLVGWWPFNGNAIDESGNEKHGTVNGAFLTSDQNGVANRAYNFDGSKSFIALPLLNLGGQNGFSISSWVKVTDFNTKYSNYHILRQEGSAGLDWLLAFQNYGSTLSFGLSTQGKLYTELDYGILASKFIGSWHNITATYDGTVKKLYLDGKLLDYEYKTGLLSLTKSANNSLGSSCSDTSCIEKIKGSIDNVAIYNRALTEQEISDMFFGDCTKPLAKITPKSTTNIKENESVVLTATKGDGYSYTWYKDGITITNAKDSIYTAKEPGKYSVKISNSCDSASSEIMVNRAYPLPNYLPTNGLIGWWPFNGNTNDESGNGNHAQMLDGSKLSTNRNNSINSAVNFDGVNCGNTAKGVYIPTKLDNTKSYSINLWYKSDDTTKNYQTIFNSIPDKYILMNLNYCAPSSMSNFLGNGSKDWLSADCSSSNNFWKIKNNTNWNNLILTKDTSSVSIYLNSVLIKKVNITKIYNSGNFNLIIGAINTYGSNCYDVFKGNLDDIAIYNRTLSQEEITALYLGEACTTPIATITPQSATSFCSGGSVNISATTNANYTYQWLNNGAPISAATTATYKATTSGKYSVIVKNNSGCIDTSSVVTVTVTPNPSMPILTGPATLCYNSKAIFKASISGGTWGVANDYLLISSPQGLFRNNKMPPSNLYKTGVTYTLKSKDQLCSVTAQKSVWIRNVVATSITLTAPKQTLKVGEEVAATATTKITGNALFWMSASSSFVSVTGTNSTYLAIVKGLRPVTGANITFSIDDPTKGCRNAAFLPFTVTAAASMVENETNTSIYTTDLNVYPNPSNGMVTIENIGDAKTISLIDVTGRVLKTTPVNADRMRLDYSNITKGNYFISIQGENLKEMKSIVIE